MDMIRAIQRSFMWNCRITIRQMPFELLRKKDVIPNQMNNTMNCDRELYKTTCVCAVHMYYKPFSRYHIKYCLGFPETKVFEYFFKFSPLTQWMH